MKIARAHSLSGLRVPQVQIPTPSREEFDSVVRELKSTIDQHTSDLRVQFERIAQMQAELDHLRMASERPARRKKSPP
jgi:hypothetical protein